MTFWTNELQSVTFDDAGNVGIGTNAPASLLHLSASAPRITLDGDSGDDPGIDFSEGGTARFSIYWDGSADALKFRDYGTADRVSISEVGVIETTCAETGLKVSMTAGSGEAAAEIQRTASDGDVIRIIQAGSDEGSIDVSGATVSYNTFLGSHWSEVSGSYFPSGSN